MVVIGNRLVQRSQNNHDGAFAFDKPVKAQTVKGRSSNLGKLTRSRGHQKACKCHPAKESLHLNRNPNRTDLGDGGRCTSKFVEKINGLGVELTPANQSSFTISCIYRVNCEMKSGEGGAAGGVEVERRAV